MPIRVSESWTGEEVEATVVDYFHMLTMELAGQEYNKSEHRRRLRQRLKERSESAVERKRQNISAVLIELGPFARTHSTGRLRRRSKCRLQPR